MKSLFSFEGRISRSKFWLVCGPFLVFSTIFLVVVFSMEDIVHFIKDTVSETSILYDILVSVFDLIFFLGMGFGSLLPVFGIWGFVLCAPLYILTIITTIKRFHDRDKSGWWLIVGLIPYIGVIWIVVECGILQGTVGTNRFGLDPLALPEQPSNGRAPLTTPVEVRQAPSTP